MDVLHLERLIGAAVFAGVRIGTLMLFAPFLGSSAIAAQVKIGFTVMLTALLYPTYASMRLTTDMLDWVRIVAGEIVIGLLLALMVQFLFDAAELAGQITGVQTGFSLVNILDPQTQVETPVLSVFHQTIALLIFLRLDVHHWLLRGLAASFSYLPPGGGVSAFSASAGLLQAASAIFMAGMQMAAPVMLATALSDIALGFLSKASPQLPVLFFGLSIKSMLGLMVLAGTLAWWPQHLEREFSTAISHSERLLHLAR